MLNNIKWKQVKGTEPLYEISNDGCIRNTKKQIIKSHIQNSGYLDISLYINKVRKHKLVHRLVALAFIDNPNSLKEVNHIDGNKQNNHVSNLEWVSSSDNKRHAIKNGVYETLKVSKRLGIKKKTSTSRYNGVAYDNSRGKWIGSVGIKGKRVGQKRFISEIDATLHVNFLLDLYSITDRPRNNI